MNSTGNQRIIEFTNRFIPSMWIVLFYRIIVGHLYNHLKPLGFYFFTRKTKTLLMEHKLMEVLTFLRPQELIYFQYNVLDE